MASLVKLFKVLFITGFLLLVTAVFMDSYKVASLSTLKSSEKQMQMDIKEKYTLAAPDAPVDESNFILGPAAPDKDATPDQKDAYTKAKAEFDAKIKDMKARYAEDMKSYNITYKEYMRKQKTLDLEKQRNAPAVKKISEKLAKDIEMKQLSINDFVLSTILRYAGSIILLIGSLGILLYGETYEKLGVFVVIGFSLKTIIGL
jgi:hypothetical protein